MHAVSNIHPKRIQPELTLTDRWDAESVSKLIAERTRKGRRPSFLFLGKHEADLLRDYLGNGFGPESVRSLRNTYYLGLEVLELDFNRFFVLAGNKQARTTARPEKGHPAWMDDSSSRWRFSA